MSIEIGILLFIAGLMCVFFGAWWFLRDKMSISKGSRCAIIGSVIATALCVFVVIGVFRNDSYGPFLRPRSRCPWVDNSPECTNANIQIVVARYSEKISWLRKKPYSCYQHVIYNKGSTEVSCPLENGCTITQLPNVGRESHTWLYHIIANYDNLADVTVFLPGSSYLPKRAKIAKCLMGQVMHTEDTVLIGRQWYDDVLKEQYEVQLDSYGSSHKGNRASNPMTALHPCSIRPLGAWWADAFPHLKDSVVHAISHTGMIAVSKEHILQNPKEYYQKLTNYFLESNSSNPEVGHYFERAWGAVFYPYPDSSIYSYKPTL